MSKLSRVYDRNLMAFAQSLVGMAMQDALDLAKQNKHPVQVVKINNAPHCQPLDFIRFRINLEVDKNNKVTKAYLG